MFNSRSCEKNRSFRIHQIRGRSSYDQNFIKLTSIASNFVNYRPNYLIKSDKALLQYSGGVGTRTIRWENEIRCRSRDNLY